MNEARFILSKKELIKQLKILEELDLKISYSYKTNREVGDVLQEISNCDFSIHSKEEIEMIKNKHRIWFFVQAESEQELANVLSLGVRRFVVDNETDLKNVLNVAKKKKIKIALSLRMKFHEHRIGTGRYFVYGMPAKKINEIIKNIKDNSFIDEIGVHIHRKSQNVNEWEIKNELKDSLTKESLKRINFLNLGGGLPIVYKSSTSKIFPYIFKKISEVKNFLDEYSIKTYFEPGRFLAGPCIKLETRIIQIQGKNIVINTTIYNCALDNLLTGTKMLVQGELEDKDEGKYFLIKGNSPTRDDIFRYRVKLANPKIGDKIVFLNAGAYNYTTDFFGYKRLKTEIVDFFR